MAEWPFEMDRVPWTVADEYRRLNARRAGRATFFPVTEFSRALLAALVERYGAPPRCVGCADGGSGAQPVSDAIARACDLGEADVLSNAWRDDAGAPGAITWATSPAPGERCYRGVAGALGVCTARCRYGGTAAAERAGRAAEWRAYWEARGAGLLHEEREQYAADERVRRRYGITKDELLARRAGEKDGP